MLSLPAAMAIVFLINAIPAFMPPTWAFLSYLYITQGGDPFLLAVFGAISSSLGRIALAKWSGPLLSRFFNKQIKENVEFAKEEFNRHGNAEFIASFLYALSPLPSNALFIVGGAANLRLARIVAGFFLGRVISYYFMIIATSFAADALSLSLGLSDMNAAALDVLGILFAIAFFLIDWKSLLGKKRH
jgi:membrane protein YqaA with SNARE-associated domain